MNPFLPTRPRVLVLLWAALALLACDPLREHPEPPKPPPTQSPPEQPVLTVTLESTEPVRCRAGQEVTIAATIEGGTPQSVSLSDGRTSQVETLVAPYRYTLDCSTYLEGTYSFVVTAQAGGRSFASPPKPVVVDRWAPYLEERRPRTAFPGVNEPVELVFSEPIDPHSLGTVPVVLRNGGGFSVAHQATLSEDGTVLRIVPTQPLVPPVSLHVELTPQTIPTDLAGNPLSQSHLLGFSVEYWPFARVGDVPSEATIHWSEFILSPGGDGAEGGVIAWTETLDKKAELLVARRKGTAWERLPPPRAEGERTHSVVNPLLAFDDKARLVLAWIENSGPDSRRIHVKRFDGTAWESLGSPNGEEVVFIFSLSMVLEQDGDPVLAWGDHFNVHVARWDGKGWDRLGGPISANPESGSLSQEPALSVNGDRLLLAWSEAPVGETRPRLFVWSYLDGTWSRMGSPLRGGGADSFSTDKVSIAVVGAEPVLVWSEMIKNPEGGVMYFSRWDWREQEWIAPELVQGMTDALELGVPRLVVNNNVLWAAWQRRGENGWPQIVYRRRSLDGWEPEQLTSSGYLAGFGLDRLGFPWVTVWRNIAPEGVVLTRPQ
ncbi:Ig-like domain-containing protein [Archangium violaceum]|uniref:Ig-like domain-containing protein n=1 Tax=Archangium violaceum TaxID=83451 RepID=UPI0036DC0C7D